MKAIWLLLGCISAPLWAEVHSSHGTHGMVLLDLESQLIASHLPLPAGKHAHQILLSIDTELPAAVRQALKADELVTLEPEPFALQDLQQGLLKDFKARVYLGHFERGGQSAGTVTVKVRKKLLDKAVGFMAEQAGYYRVPVGQGELLVNAIAGEGAVDQILYLRPGQAAKALYFERADFAPQAK